MNLKLWKFDFDCGRDGSLKGLFLATQEEINDALGQDVYFGEVLGKHSEIYGELEECDIEKIEVSEAFIQEGFKKFGVTWSGYNPLDYISEKELEGKE